MPVVLWSRRFDGVTARPPRGELEELGLADVGGLQLTLAPTPAEVAARMRRAERAPRARQGDARHHRRERARDAAAGRDRRQHLARRAGRSRGARRRGARRGIRVGLDVFDNEPAAADGRLRDAAGVAPWRLRHAPHRRVHRSGAGSHRRRDGAHRARVQGDRRGAERRQSGAAHAGDAHAGRAPPRSSGRAGARVRHLRARAASTCRRPRTSCSRARRPRSPASISMARRTRRCSTPSTGNADMLDLQVVQRCQMTNDE